MKLVVILMVAVGVALCAPKNDHLGFRNLYKKPITNVKPHPAGRIVGGEIAEPNSIPYQVFLIFYAAFSGWYCGGSLITPRYILTAGHCGEDGLEVEVIFGAQDLTKEEPTQLVLSSYKIIVHPDFDMEQILYDIALIRLPQAVTLNEYIQLVRLPTLADVDNSYVGKIGKVSGWGLTDGKAEEISYVLMYTENPIISNEECNEIYGIVEDYQVCMSGEDGRSSCNGDSGGPFTVDGVQIGVVSYGVENCEPGYPSAYTRTTSFLNWIEQNSDYQLS